MGTLPLQAGLFLLACDRLIVDFGFLRVRFTGGMYPWGFFCEPNSAVITLQEGLSPTSYYKMNTQDIMMKSLPRSTQETTRKH